MELADEITRKPRIGGSEIAAIFGCHSFLDEFGLWLRKRGDLPRGGDWTDRMRLGKHLEQGITAYAAELQGWEYEWWDKSIKSEQYPFMVSSPDALIPAKRWGIDAKLVSWDQAFKWGRTVDRIPDHNVMQAWWYMAALDYEGWYITPLIMGEDRPRIYRVLRDLPAERAMLKKAEEWWKRYIVGDERPPITASDATDRWLKHHHPRERGPEIAAASDDEADLLDHYTHVRREHEIAFAERRDLEARIKAAIGDRAGLKWDGGKFTWKKAKDSIQTEWEDLANILLERHPAKETLLEEYTYPKPGVRRIYFKSNRGEETEL